MPTIKKFVHEALIELRESVPKKEFIIGNINFEIAVTATSKGRGGIDLQVLQAGAAKSSQTTHKISFSVTSREATAHMMEMLGDLVNVFKKYGRKKRRK